MENDRKRRRTRGRTTNESFLALPHAVLRSANYRALSGFGIKLLIDLAGQLRGSNNGDLSAAWAVVQPLGWKSRDTLSRALREVQHYRLIEKTRQGGLNQCSLFAVTWLPIDYCQGKLDASATTVASGLWKLPAEPMPKEQKNASPNTGGVSSRHGRRVRPTREACQ